ncbi:MAG: Gfo/Idh/MocA family protein [Betaproteobacteria bacterium]|jgi:predicted dehydrogenase
MKKVRIVIVGPGLIGKKHIDLVRANPETELVGIVAPDHAPHHEFANNLGVRLHHSLEAMLNEVEVDGVIIASPNIFHAEQATFCIKKGIAVFVEKPITHTFTDGQRLVELAEQHDAKVLIGHHRAHSPILSAAREVIKSGKLGEIVAIMGSALFYKPASYFEAGSWRRELGGGPILINLIHEIGNFRSLCGEITAVQAMASAATRNFAVEDSVAIIFQFAGGALGTFLLSDTAASARSWEQTSQENKSYPTYPDEDCYSVSGTMGSLSIPTMRIKYYRSEAEQSWWSPFVEETIDVSRKDPLACQLDHFVDVVRGEAMPLVSARDGLRNLQITEAIAESARTRQMVRV